LSWIKEEVRIVPSRRSTSVLQVFFESLPQLHQHLPLFFLYLLLDIDRDLVTIPFSLPRSLVSSFRTFLLFFFPGSFCKVWRKVPVPVALASREVKPPPPPFNRLRPRDCFFDCFMASSRNHFRRRTASPIPFSYFFFALCQQLPCKNFFQ